MLKWLANLFTGSTVNRALDLAGEYIEDPDKLNALILEAFKLERDIEIARLNVSTIAWVDALHKMMRPLMWLSVIGFYAYAKINNIEIDLNELALLVAGPGAYTLMKGRGR